MTTRLEAWTDPHAFVNPDGTIPPISREPMPCWRNNAETASSGRDEYGGDQREVPSQHPQPVSGEPRCGGVSGPDKSPRVSRPHSEGAP